MNQTPLQDGTFEMENFIEMKSYCNRQGIPFYLVKLQSLQDGLWKATCQARWLETLPPHS
jgi:hypothetical protein